MGIRYSTQRNLLPGMVQQAKALHGKAVEVGVLDGEHAWLAGIHEYGCTITAKNGKYLTIPCNPQAAKASARSFPDLFVLTLDDGSRWLVRNQGKDRLEFMYQLVQSVQIPERSFLRAGFDACHEAVMQQVERALKNVLTAGNAEDVLRMCGKQLASQIKAYARDLKNPPKEKITIAASGGGKTNPLFQTGAMINGITYRFRSVAE